MFFASLGSSLPHIKARRLRAVAVAGKTRSPALPDVPTLAESGVPGYEMYEWNAVFAPTGTPQPVIARVHKALVDVLADPEIRSRLEGLGADVIGSTPAELETFRRAELAKWSALVKANKLHLD